MTVVAVLGAGSWGTALADLLAKAGRSVRLWAYEAEVAGSIARNRENTLYFPGRSLSPALRATADLSEALQGAGIVVMVTPSHVFREVLRTARPNLRPGTLLISGSKGLEAESLALMSAVAAEEAPSARFVAVSGPSFAQEVYEGQPTAVVAASTDPDAAAETQQLLSNPRFRVYSSSDVVGTQLAGALKNVIAIAAGVLEGLGLGHNPRAALLSRGLAEMARLGMALEADSATFAGLAGMGDLILTACGPLSRNRSLGVALGQGSTLERYRATHRSVAEGVNTAQAAVRMGEQYRVELPIATEVANVLFHQKAPKDAIADLMDRTLKAEHWR